MDKSVKAYCRKLVVNRKETPFRIMLLWIDYLQETESYSIFVILANRWSLSLHSVLMWHHTSFCPSMVCIKACVQMGFLQSSLFFFIFLRLKVIGHWLVGLLTFLGGILVLGVELWGCFFRISSSGFIAWLLCSLNTVGFSSTSAGTNAWESSYMLSSEGLGHSLAFTGYMAASVT